MAKNNNNNNIESTQDAIESKMDMHRFLGEFEILGLSIGTVIGFSLNNLSNSMSKEIITPLIAPIFGFNSLKTFRFKIWKFDFGIGDFISEIISFLIICLVLYLIFAKFFKSFLTKVLEIKDEHEIIVEDANEKRYKNLQKLNINQDKIINHLININNELKKPKRIIMSESDNFI